MVYLGTLRRNETIAQYPSDNLGREIQAEPLKAKSILPLSANPNIRDRFVLSFPQHPLFYVILMKQ